jgi:hypothetical protein
MTKLTVIIIVRYQCYQLYTKFIEYHLLKFKSLYIDEIIGDHQCVFQHNRSTSGQIFCICREYNKTVHQLFIDFKKVHDSVRREVLYNILIDFGYPKKLLG